MIDLEECIKKGMIRKTHPSKNQALASIEKAKKFLEEAKAGHNDKRFNSAVLMAYLVVLNASRSILFRDGYRERSHACITRYLEEKYKNIIPLDTIYLLDHYRETRHELQYETDYMADEKGSAQILEFADKFVVLVEKLVE
ncbi:MAG: HEPN domain-containing protein [Candidatus Micrarchaeota archaeon]